ncbi:YodL domain-containing protein [Niallia taxi]|uniref:YodL domain-containing protein n=1 Tax=Niallia taxi TaxID=2499688 RepID=UPI003008A43D
MKYTIFQMPFSLVKNTAWWSEDSVVQKEDFLPVYKGEFQTSSRYPEDILNELFEIFNLKHPKDYASRSLSSGDVIKLNENEYYLCCSMGWYKLTSDF